MTRKLNLVFFLMDNGLDAPDMLAGIPHNKFNIRVIHLMDRGVDSGPTISYAFRDYSENEKLFDDLLSWETDVVFQVSKKLTSGGSYLSFFCQHYGIRLVSWHVDNPSAVGQPSYDKSLSCMVNLLYDACYVDEMNKRGFPNNYYMPMGTNPDRFKLPERDDRPFDIGFVGGTMTDWTSRCLRGLSYWIRNTQGNDHLLLKYAKQRAEHLAKHPHELDQWRVMGGTKFSDVDAYKVLKDKVPMPLWDNEIDRDRLVFMTGTLIDCFATMVLRTECVKALIGEGIQVWGGPEWLQYGVPEANYRGQVPRNRVHSVYQQCKVLLDVSRFQFPSSLNHRFYDASACGAVVVSLERTGDQSLDFSTKDNFGFLSFRHNEWAEMRSVVRVGIEGYLGMGHAASRHIMSAHTYKHRWDRLHEIVTTLDNFSPLIDNNPYRTEANNHAETHTPGEGENQSPIDRSPDQVPSEASSEPDSGARVKRKVPAPKGRNRKSSNGHRRAKTPRKRVV